jgi:hypothetical protein
LAGDDEERVGELRYLLRIHNYRVFSALGVAEAERMLASIPVDLVLVVWPLEGGGALLGHLRATFKATRALVVDGPQPRLPVGWAADGALCRGHCPFADILEAVKILTARRPGPRSGAQRS